MAARRATEATLDQREPAICVPRRDYGAVGSSPVPRADQCEVDPEWPRSKIILGQRQPLWRKGGNC